MKKINSDYLRNFVFGIEDSLVSTGGVLFGLASSGQYTSSQIILSGLIIISVEALSMGVGSFLSEKTVHESPDGAKHRDSPIVGGFTMFLSYILAGLAALLPYVFLKVNDARFLSITIILLSLFFAGYLPKRKLKNGIRMLLLAGGAILVGLIIGKTFKIQ